MAILNTPFKALIHGQEGVGKTTDASRWPGAHFIDIEGSTERMDVHRLPDRNPYQPPQSWSEVMNIINGLMQSESANMQKTLIIDTVDSMTPLLVAHVCATNKKKDGMPAEKLTEYGWDAGYELVATEFGRFLASLEELRIKKQWHVVLVCHSAVRRVDLPEQDSSYDRWEPDLFRRPKNTPSPYDLVKAWAEMVLFYCFKTLVVTLDSGKTKAAGEQRVIRTTHAATWDAKNRNGLPDELPMEPGKFALACLFRKPKAPAAAPPSAPVAPVAPTAATPPTAPPLDATPAPATGKVSQATLEKLKALMNGTWPEVQENEVMAAVHAAGHFPAGMPLEDLPEEYVAGRLVGNWDKVLKVINRLRKPQAEGEAA